MRKLVLKLGLVVLALAVTVDFAAACGRRGRHCGHGGGGGCGSGQCSASGAPAPAARVPGMVEADTGQSWIVSIPRTEWALYERGVQVGAWNDARGIYRPYDRASDSWGLAVSSPPIPPPIGRIASR